MLVSLIWHASFMSMHLIYMFILCFLDLMHHRLGLLFFRKVLQGLSRLHFRVFKGFGEKYKISVNYFRQSVVESKSFFHKNIYPYIQIQRKFTLSF